MSEGYGGVYRAFCVSDKLGSTSVTIAQVFSTQVVPLFASAGGTPEAGQWGWVSFVSGDAAYPVWLGPDSPV